MGASPQQRVAAMRRNAIAKLLAPAPSRVLRRPRVIAALSRMMEASHGWVAAPAGYGKTTAAVDYLSSRQGPYLWCRLDEDDQDPASLYHYLSLCLDPQDAAALPAFGAEYADQSQAFARRFFRGFFAALPAELTIVLDDVHDAESDAFHGALAILLRETPPGVRCLCLSRTLPADPLREAALTGRLRVVGAELLQFSDAEARALLEVREATAPAPVEQAGGWAAGLVLMAERSAGDNLWPAPSAADHGDQPELFELLGRQIFDALPSPEQDMLLKLGLLPEVTPKLAAAMVGSSDASGLLERLHRRQFLVTRLEPGERPVFRLHDLLRDFLSRRLETAFAPADRLRLALQAAQALAADGRPAQAIDLALRYGAQDLAAELIVANAENMLDQGRRATFLDWCGRLGENGADPWLCYWRGVALLPDDEAAEPWFERAYRLFTERGDQRGRRLAIARAVLVKTDSWRTHSGLSTWTARALELQRQPAPTLGANDELLVLMGLLRALDFADDYSAAAPFAAELSRQLTQRLLAPCPQDSPNLRLLASAGVIEHAGSTARPELFHGAVDAVAGSLADTALSPWVLGLWLVAFGAVSGRYFLYARRGFPYADAEAALRSAIEIGEREGFPGVEFGGLYHLQYQLKLQNRWADYAALVARLAKVADSRHSTQVAVVADCEAALHTRFGRVEAAEAACARFLTAVETAGEPPIERWPHYVTRFQSLLGAARFAEAATYMRRLAPQFDAGVADRTIACALIAEALEARIHAPATYPAHLAAAVDALSATGWSAALANLPQLLAEMLGDALDQGHASEFCAGLARQRRLEPPTSRPAAWPWALRVYVLGDFRLELGGQPLPSGPKPPARSLDLLRALATAPDHACAMSDLCDWLWPDLDGDQAKAACEQALQRLRRLMGRPDLVIQREGRLHLRKEEVWVDLDHWWGRLRAAPRETVSGVPGPVLPHEHDNPWALAAGERFRRDVIDAAIAAGTALQVSDGANARLLHQHVLDLYPDAVRIHEAMITKRLADHDMIGAWDDYERFQRACGDLDDSRSAAAIRDLMRRADGLSA